MFLNAGLVAGDVVCDEACWTAAGFATADFPLEATDLWTGEPLPDIESPQFVAKQLGAAGGHLVRSLATPALSASGLPASAACWRVATLPLTGWSRTGVARRR